MLALQLVNLPVSKNAPIHQTAFRIDKRLDLHARAPSIFTLQVKQLAVLCRAPLLHDSNITVLILHHRDCGLNSFSLQLLHVFAMNLGRLLDHGDHRPQRITKPVVAFFRTVTTHSEMAHGCLAGIKMTMPHEVARRIDRADAEFMAHPRLAVLPEHDVAFTLGDDNHGAGTVAMKRCCANPAEILKRGNRRWYPPGCNACALPLCPSWENHQAQTDSRREPDWFPNIDPPCAC